MIGGDQATCAAVTDALSRHRVTPVRTVEEGLVALAGGDVDLVVLDLAPPGGLATLARIRGSRHGALPVAALSPRASELDHVSCRSRPACVTGPAPAWTYGRSAGWPPEC